MKVEINVCFDNGEGCTIGTSGPDGLVPILAEAVVEVINSYNIPCKYALFIECFHKAAIKSVYGKEV